MTQRHELEDIITDIEDVLYQVTYEQDSYLQHNYEKPFTDAMEKVKVHLQLAADEVDNSIVALFGE